MISWVNTPFDDVIQATKNIYGEIYCEIEFDSTLKEVEGVYGLTTWLPNGRVIVSLDAKTEIETQIETLGHELAHVVAGADEEHGPKWEKIFNDIFEEYNRYCKDKYLD